MASVANRQDISKNTLMLAREAVKRFPEHKELCRKFLQTYEHDGDGVLDPKFGRRKYKAMLRSAVNRHLDTIYIDLDDLDAYCRLQLQGPGLQGAESLSTPKLGLQQSISTLARDVEDNTLRYAKFFYEACDAEKPHRDEGFNVENADTAFETIQQWRERKLQRQVENGQPAGEIPAQMRNPFNVCFKPRKDCQTLKFREVTAMHVGALVSLECLVVRCSEVKPRIEVVTYQCEQCEAEIFQSVEGEQYQPPKECPSQKCKERKQSGKLRANNRTSKFGKYQEMRVQEMSEHVPVGGVPRAINVVLSGDNCRTCSPGDAITLTGVFRPYQLPWFQTMKKGTSQDMYVDAHFVAKHKLGYSEQSDEGVTARLVEEAFERGSIYEQGAKSIGPEIFGLLDMKKALLLALVGGVTNNMTDGMKIRGEIHTLFMGDPGVAKSQLLKQVCNIAPRSVYTTGKGASGVGLTASVVRDNITQEVSLEGGALVLADLGVCCIDEFDKMAESDRTSIHEVMEQQSISIAKAGITTTLNTRTTVLAAANPAFGRYDPYKSPIENMDLPPALLSRFDLLFLLLDTVDNDKDNMLAKHVCKVHSSYALQSAKASRAEGAAADDAAADGDVLNLGFKAFSADFMRSYVRRAKTYEPVVSDSLQKDIVDAYVSMRDDESRGDIDSRKSYTTPRTLLAILRLSQAHARARFSNKVERQDFDEAMRLMKASKESIELSAPAKRGQNPLEIVYDIVADLSRRATSPEGWVEMAHVISMSGHKALNVEQVREAMENWESLSVMVQNPEKTAVRFMIPVE